VSVIFPDRLTFGFRTLNYNQLKQKNSTNTIPEEQRSIIMAEDKEKKDYCDAKDQKKVVEKMSDCDKSSENDKERDECYTKVIKNDDGCMS
jgi:hypothetical protein